MNGVDRRVQDLKVAGRSAGVALWSPRRSTFHSGCSMPFFERKQRHSGRRFRFRPPAPRRLHLPLRAVESLGCRISKAPALSSLAVSLFRSPALFNRENRHNEFIFLHGSQLPTGPFAMVELTAPAAARTQYWPIFPMGFEPAFNREGADCLANSLCSRFARRYLGRSFGRCFYQSNGGFQSDPKLGLIKCGHETVTPRYQTSGLQPRILRSRLTSGL